MTNTRAFSLILLLLLGTSCKSSVPNSLRDTLIVVEDASAVKYVRFQGSDQLTYTVDTPYPAGAVIDAITTQLQKKNWTPLKEDWLNPGLTSSHSSGWSSFSDATTTPHTIVFQWLAQWKDENGNIVSYAFQYRDPGDYPVSMKPTSTSMKVSAAYFPRDVADAMIKWATSHKNNGSK